MSSREKPGCIPCHSRQPGPRQVQVQVLVLQKGQIVLHDSTNEMAGSAALAGFLRV